MPDTIIQTGPGYTTDPYNAPEERAECDDPISKLFAKITGPGGLFSTWRERHISIMGAAAGWRAGTLSPVPTCPPLWQDECQYYDGCAMLANVLKCQWPTVVAGLTAIIGLIVSGVVKIG